MKKREMGPAGNMDYVKPGSEQHAAMIGLRRAEETDLVKQDGWTLADMTVFGSGVLESFVRETLRQKVVTLKAGAPPAPQSLDPLAPGYAVPMWRPQPDAGQ